MKKYCIVGASHRALFYLENIVNNYSDLAKVVAVYDPNITRSNYFKTIEKDIIVYNDFDCMLEEIKPDTLIVTTIDSVHDEYINRALNKGCNVITEKPMTINKEKCKAIFETEAKSGKKVTVTFNYRFMPYISKIKELLVKKVIGSIKSVTFEYLLGKPHGSDYMRRWHAEKENSGGMLIHKSTHHFDLVNWLLDDEPETVIAHGSLDVFGPNNEKFGENCRSCFHKKNCEYYLDITNNELFKHMYIEAEHEDGYLRDRCVFDKRINIFDNMSVSVKYSRGALLTYALNLYNPYEGFKLVFTGDQGRIEAHQYHSGLQTQESTEQFNQIKVIHDNNENIIYQFSDNGGSHGGGDKKMLDMIFCENIDDKYCHMAGTIDGAKSILIGICANESIETGKKINIKNTLDELKNIKKNVKNL